MLQRRRRRARADDVHIAAAEQVAHALALALVVLHHQHAAQILGELGLQPLQGMDQFLALDGLERVAHGAAPHGLLRIVGHRDHVHGNVARDGVALELVQHAQAREIGQVDVQHDGVGLVACRHGQAVGRGVGHLAFEIHLARELGKNVGKAQIVLNDEDAAPALPALSQGIRRGRSRQHRRRHGWRHGRRERGRSRRDMGRGDGGHGRGR